MMPLATDNIERNRKWERVALADVLVRLLRMAASIHVLTGYETRFNTRFDKLRKPRYLTMMTIPGKWTPVSFTMQGLPFSRYLPWGR